MRCLALPFAALLATASALVAPPAPAAAASTYDSGLNVPFESPDAVSGNTVSVVQYGATSGNPNDDDAAAIQRAINAARPGDMVYIPDGTYHVKSMITLKSGVSVVGQSRDGTILAGSYSASPYAVMYAAPGVNNLTLSNFRLGVAAGKPYLAGIRLGNTGSTVVARIAVSNLLIEQFQRFGIQVQNGKFILADSNIIRNATALDGDGSGYGVIIDQSGSNNNWIKNNLIGPTIRHGVLLQYRANHNLIEHNTVTGSVSGSIDLHGEDEYSNEISYNLVSDCVRNGTSVSPNGGGIEVGEFSGIAGTTLLHDNSGPYNWIHHNEVSNCTYGVRITNNSNYTYVEDNSFHDNLVSGIQADLAPLNNLLLARNQVYQNGNGVLLYNVTKAVIQGNRITDNAGYGLWTNPGVTGFVISDNTVTGNKVNVVLGSKNGTYTEGAAA